MSKIATARSLESLEIKGGVCARARGGALRGAGGSSSREFAHRAIARQLMMRVPCPERRRHWLQPLPLVALFIGNIVFILRGGKEVLYVYPKVTHVKIM